jgi:hypothetical protein
MLEKGLKLPQLHSTRVGVLSNSGVINGTLGAGDPGFKSQRPHHDNSGPIVGLHYFLLLHLLFESLTGRIDGNVSRTSFKFCEGICIT